MSTRQPVLEIEKLRVTFTGGAKPVRAVDGVDLTLERGEVVALLGESGSGKSVTLRSILRLHNEKRTRIEGRIAVSGIDVMGMGQAELGDFRGPASRDEVQGAASVLRMLQGALLNDPPWRSPPRPHEH